MRYAFLGSTRFSEEVLSCLIEAGYRPEMVFYLKEEISISYSKNKVKIYNYADLGEFCRKKGVEAVQIDKDKGITLSRFRPLLCKLNLDVLLVMGWYYMIPRAVRSCFKLGAWGIHASLLPKYAGGAPLVWAMINGEQKTGVTLFRLADGIDNGDIIAQREFPIEITDTIETVYNKATEASKEILLRVFKEGSEHIQFTPQNKEDIQVWPQRSPEDGAINLKWDADRIFDFIRAQVSPYPGAFIQRSDGTKLFIERIRIEKNNSI